LGGEADKCPVYELYAYLLTQDDDSYAQRVYEECTNGTRLCGDCKEEAANLMREFLKDYQQKIKEVEPLLEQLNSNTPNPEERS
jgi:tryptophanyl-tRNA synthetase